MRNIILSVLAFAVILFACQKAETNNKTNTYIHLCDTTSVSYKNDIAPIMIKYCNSCHGGVNPSVGNIDYSNYEQLAPLAADSPYYIYNVVSYNNRFKKMPPYPSPRLDTCEILKILAWTNRKAPNN